MKYLIAVSAGLVGFVVSLAALVFVIAPFVAVARKISLRQALWLSVGIGVLITLLLL